MTQLAVSHGGRPEQLWLLGAADLASHTGKDHGGADLIAEAIQRALCEQTFLTMGENTD